MDEERKLKNSKGYDDSMDKNHGVGAASLTEWYALAHSAAKDYISKMQLENSARNYKTIGTGEVEISYKGSKIDPVDPNLLNLKDRGGLPINSLLNNDLFNPSKFSVDDIMRHSMLLLSKDINFSAITKNDYSGKPMEETKSNKRNSKTPIDNMSSYKIGKDLPGDLSARMEVRLPPDTEIIKYTSSMSDKSSVSSYSEDLSRKRLKLDPEVSISSQSSSSDDRHKISNEDMNSDAPLNLSLKSEPATKTIEINPDNADNLNNLKNLSASIIPLDHKGNFKENRPRNLGRGISKPKKNTVASLLAQSRAYGTKPHMGYGNGKSGGEEMDYDYNNDISYSGSENESSTPRTNDLRIPIEMGWRRETLIKNILESGEVKGEVYYCPPESNNQFKNIYEVQKFCEQTQSKLTNDHFSFSTKHIIGNFYYITKTESNNDDLVMLTENQMSKKLKEMRRKSQSQEVIEVDLDNPQVTDKKDNVYLQDLNKQKEYFYALELERERKKQLSYFIKQLETRNCLESSEKLRHRDILEKLIHREKMIDAQKQDAKLLHEIRKPQEDLSIKNHVDMPSMNRVHGLKLTGQTFADLLMVYEFIWNFGETLGFDMESLPNLITMHNAIIEKDNTDAEEELLLVLIHLLSCAIDDPGISNPNRHTTNLGQTLRQVEMNPQNVSESLRIYLNVTAMEEMNVDMNQSDMDDDELKEQLNESQRFVYSEMLNEIPFAALKPSIKAKILAFMCDDLLLNKAVVHQIENGLDLQAQYKKERFLLDSKIRKYKSFLARKYRQDNLDRSMSVEKSVTNDQKVLTQDKSESVADVETSSNVNDDEIDTIEEPTDKPSPIEKELNFSSMTVDKVDEDNSDLESESTFLDDEEDMSLTMDEANKRLEKMLDQSVAVEKQLYDSLNSLRAKNLGQDRFHRQYWLLPKSGGIFVEGMETAEPEIFESYTKQNEENNKDDNDDDCEIISATDEPSNSENNVTNFEKKPSQNHNMTDFEMKNDETFDIEESIPTAILVQKENKNNDSRFVEINHVVPNNPAEEEHKKQQQQQQQEQQELQQKLQQQQQQEQEDKEVKEIKEETEDYPKEDVKPPKKKKERTGKWFSLLNRHHNPQPMNGKLSHKNLQCKDIIYMTGFPWEIQNNLQYEGVEVLTNGNDNNVANDTKNLASCDSQTEIRTFTLPHFLKKSIHELDVFLKTDTLTPMQVTIEEQRLLEEIKKNGFLKDTIFTEVPEDVRQGWWNLLTTEEVKDLVKCLNIKGIREKALRQNLVTLSDEHVKAINPENECSKISAEKKGSEIDIQEMESETWDEEIVKRVEKYLLEQIEILEEKLAAASMQVKGWVMPERTDSGSVVNIDIIRNRVMALETIIERRYLKPPLGNNSAEAQLAAIANESQDTKQDSDKNDKDVISKGLTHWRDAVEKSTSVAQLTLALNMLEQCIAWDKSIMKANCQFCHSGESEDKLLLCDGCDRGYHTYCFKPKMEKIPEGDWFCFECLNKATGDKNCIVCGNRRPPPVGKMINCELCPRVYHFDCYIPTLQKPPRGKWYCYNCRIKAPPRKKTVKKAKDPKPVVNSTNANANANEEANNSTTSPVKAEKNQNTSNVSKVADELDESSNIDETSTANVEKKEKEVPIHSDNSNSVNDAKSSDHEKEFEKQEAKEKAKAERKNTKKLSKDFAVCKIILEEMEVHDDSWPFLLPVNTKQFPTYKKIIKHPMDISTIKKRLSDSTYKSLDEFVSDVRLIFDNCEKFNEDDSPVGKAGHGMRKYFELRWAELTNK